MKPLVTALAATLLLAAPSFAQTTGGKYVAMGSSFAAGPMITTSADTPADRCRRSKDNYPHQLARKRNLTLIDVSCSGATTAHILGPWDPFPAQLDALTPDVTLVTVTIGGNDLGYMTLLNAAACANRAASPQASAACPIFNTPPEEAFRALEARLEDIARETRRRAPNARLVFVQYFTVLPQGDLCRALPITPAQSAAARALVLRLTDATARAAKATGAGVLDLHDLSADHHACASAPWVNGYLGQTPATDGTSWHPNLAGMTAAADALDRLLSR